VNEPPPRVDVVIVAFRSREHVLRCLASLEREAERIPLTVTVVDNDSRDGTPEAIRDAFPWVTAIALEENAGFARPTNLAAARGTAEYVLALNPDTELEPGTIERLLEVFAEEPDVAVVGPRLLREDGSLDHASRRSFPTILGSLGHFAGIGRRLQRGPLAQYRAPDVERGRVDAVNGAFMLMRRSAFDACGGFDERYWLYMEDLDLSYRLAQAGWASWYEPSVTVLHVKGASAGPIRSAALERAFHDGMLRFYRSHYAPGRSRTVNAAVSAGIGLRLAWRIATIPARRLVGRI
jgi:GT2 family glycosyltransferase